MGKKKEDAPPPGSPAWMATFSDLMNLLLCFFVLLFSMSTIDEAKLNEIIASLNSSFSVFSGGATSIGEGILISNGVSQLNELSNYISSTGRAADSETQDTQIQVYNTDSGGKENTESSEDNTGAMNIEQAAEAVEAANLSSNEELAELIGEAIADSRLSDQIDVSFTSQYVMLTMKGSILFAPGSATLNEDCKPVLDRVSSILERYARGEIEINGHTDNVPMNSAKYPSNEELSSARALSVFYYIVETSSLDPTLIKHSGFGERMPIADNSTEAGRARNRRVEIRIYNNN
ncbi:MAG: flagellar motor protein MotB [Lachnospiraceae bacterium]|jgi:chemotaxis protein MotB|nr:flagellar motor protein MotB [Lachnospiraceae bacterium]